MDLRNGMGQLIPLVGSYSLGEPDASVISTPANLCAPGVLQICRHSLWNGRCQRLKFQSKTTGLRAELFFLRGKTRIQQIGLTYYKGTVVLGIPHFRTTPYGVEYLQTSTCRHDMGPQITRMIFWHQTTEPAVRLDNFACFFSLQWSV